MSSAKLRAAGVGLMLVGGGVIWWGNSKANLRRQQIEEATRPNGSFVITEGTAILLAPHELSSGIDRSQGPIVARASWESRTETETDSSGRTTTKTRTTRTTYESVPFFLRTSQGDRRVEGTLRALYGCRHHQQRGLQSTDHERFVAAGTRVAVFGQRDGTSIRGSIELSCDGRTAFETATLESRLAYTAGGIVVSVVGFLAFYFL